MTVMLVDQSAPLASLHSALTKTQTARRMPPQSQQVEGSKLRRRCATCLPSSAPPPPSRTPTSSPRAGRTPTAPRPSSPPPRWSTSRVARWRRAGGPWTACWCRWRSGACRWSPPCTCSPPPGSFPGRSSAGGKPVQIARTGTAHGCVSPSGPSTLVHTVEVPRWLSCHPVLPSALRCKLTALLILSKTSPVWQVETQPSFAEIQRSLQCGRAWRRLRVLQAAVSRSLNRV